MGDPERTHRVLRWIVYAGITAAGLWLLAVAVLWLWIR